METAIKPYRMLEEELLFVKEFLAAEAYVSEEELEWDCTIDEEADTSVPVPGGLVKSFVEHALLKEISKHPEGGRIEVSVHRTKLGILIIVNDNGSLRYKEYGRGNLIGNRLELLDQQIIEYNKHCAQTISYQLLDLAYAEPGQTGTRVLITITI
jgi:LytS/YehU family sensor histidine kinase